MFHHTVHTCMASYVCDFHCGSLNGVILKLLFHKCCKYLSCVSGKKLRSGFKDDICIGIVIYYLLNEVTYKGRYQNIQKKFILLGEDRPLKIQRNSTELNLTQSNFVGLVLTWNPSYCHAQTFQ